MKDMISTPAGGIKRPKPRPKNVNGTAYGVYKTDKVPEKQKYHPNLDDGDYVKVDEVASSRVKGLKQMNKSNYAEAFKKVMKKRKAVLTY